ncbi:putative AP-3 complex subunit delta [Aspergillus brunneoviolaceus CBS 621.78]|uniref:Adaptor protein complex AP-3 delta subunit n=1 Tax=Aspergillus brunneoviolaceus CBS 621.78 TaxID=1450534 RepID=A0ACD1FUK2_9EURO|nr:Adaptor protein complex AP-3 delta subunit [Aspergillus brunneoviolaceus CBS 621.78]RAH40676.1 Adaptor protein complex AP-3 delta subunit [Aspergillus brunneoviolaceus CBS 621.78]
MFEKSLYDLIKGLRSHKGDEDGYIQESLRECKAEIKLQDMDKKATALLKLIYLEMFGYDMSWASFHVLEVMSSAKYLQKRAGYLGAVQSFRPDTEVLMLATNLLKKDLVSSSIPNMSLPLITLPSIITTSLAMSLLPDVLSRISHTHAVVRKKAIVCLYRLALVYPDALKLAWPKIKERLMDDAEDSSVTTAVLNVVCELGWRRSRDFLPLAPRLFELLVDGGNNWMAIKIIKLFATLTPLEPRLVRKLLRPLVNIIQTTTAMSLLYECINGLIQGGILDSDQGAQEKDEIADLCVEKLRGMVVSDSDPNLKYVALLAFNRIVSAYPALVSMHQDVIMYCLDDADISIRLQALDLATRMVTSDNLQAIVERLILQLVNSREFTGNDRLGIDDELSEGDGREMRRDSANRKTTIPLPLDYQLEVLHRIVDICSYGNYANLSDFDWYVGALVRLVQLLPSDVEDVGLPHDIRTGNDADHQSHITGRIGSELRNVAVRVKDARAEATRAAASLLSLANRKSLSLKAPGASNGILGPLAWMVGEYAEHLLSPGQTLFSLIDMSNFSLPGRMLSLYVQAIPKLLNTFLPDEGTWDRTKRSEMSLMLARVIEFLNSLSLHPDLEVQERAIEFLEVMRLAADAVHSDSHNWNEVPFLLSTVIPNLFKGLELNPVSVNAQKKVTTPELLHLHQTFNDSLCNLFDSDLGTSCGADHEVPSHKFYYCRDGMSSDKQLGDFVAVDAAHGTQYQKPVSIMVEESSTYARRLDGKERSRDDPFYIGTDDGYYDILSPHHPSFTASNESELDVDAIPIIDLQLHAGRGHRPPSIAQSDDRKKIRSRPKRYNVLPDEMLGDDEAGAANRTGEASKWKRSLLQIDSSGLEHPQLSENRPFSDNQSIVRRVEDEAEMVLAMREVEQFRLRLQRATERVQPMGIPSEGTLVKKKKKKTKSVVNDMQGTGWPDDETGLMKGSNDRQQQKKKKKKKRPKN